MDSPGNDKEADPVHQFDPSSYSFLSDQGDLGGIARVPGRRADEALQQPGGLLLTQQGELILLLLGWSCFIEPLTELQTAHVGQDVLRRPERSSTTDHTDHTDGKIT